MVSLCLGNNRSEKYFPKCARTWTSSDPLATRTHETDDWFKQICTWSLSFLNNPSVFWRMTLWSECLCPPQIHRLRPNSEGDAVWMWALGGDQVMRAGPPWVGLLWKAPGSSFTPSPMWHSKKSVTQTRALAQPCWHPGLGLPASTTKQRTSVVHKVPCQWYFTIAARTDWDKWLIFFQLICNYLGVPNSVVLCWTPGGIHSMVSIFCKHPE